MHSPPRLAPAWAINHGSHLSGATRCACLMEACLCETPGCLSRKGRGYRAQFSFQPATWLPSFFFLLVLWDQQVSKTELNRGRFLTNIKSFCYIHPIVRQRAFQHICLVDILCSHLVSPPQNLAGAEEMGSSRQPAEAAPRPAAPRGFAWRSTALGASAQRMPYSTCPSSPSNRAFAPHESSQSNSKATMGLSLCSPSLPVAAQRLNDNTFLISIHIHTYRNIAQ